MRQLNSNTGNGLLELPPEIEDDNDELDHMAAVKNTTPTARRRSGSGGRRRSSFGGSFGTLKSPVKSAAEQARIADMYKTVIKMSSENKINDKNSWSFDFIDQMGRLIKEDASSHRGVNFVKASCTLDASVKIYSHRVDDTCASSVRILENLSRNGVNVEEEDDEVVERGTAKVGTKSQSNKHHIAETIEKRIENLNEAVVQKQQTADPMFHKMSKAFDEGGAKGMLMTNLRVAEDSSCLVFGNTIKQEDNKSIVEEEKKTSKPLFEMMDISNLILNSGFQISELSNMAVCPTLDIYRDKLNISDSSYGLFDTSDYFKYFPQSIITTSSNNNDNNDNMDDGNNVDYGDDYGNEDEYFGGDSGDDDFDNDIINLPSNDEETRRKSLSSRQSIGGNKINWDTVFDKNATNNNNNNNKENTQLNDNDQAWTEGGISNSNEYTFFNNDLVSKNNSWAGAKHWKFGSKSFVKSAKKIVVETAQKENELEVETNLKITKVKNMKVTLDFNSKWLNDSLFTPPVSSRGVAGLQLTASAKEKNLNLSNSLLLPVDSKIQSRDLCRLYLCPRMLVPPPNFVNVILSSSQKKVNDVILSSSHDKVDLIWGETQTLDGKRVVNQPPQYNNDDDYGHDDMIYEGDDDDYEVPITQAMGGLNINSSNLLQASRTVEKVDIGYATIAKRVNVKKLKSDIWTHIDVSVSNKNEDIEDNTNHNKTPDISFQEMMMDVGENQKQKEATLPFYFICLLHLANEKGLTISDSPLMNDLRISKN